MSLNRLLSRLLLLSLCCQALLFSNRALAEIDHAPLAPGHARSAEEFSQRHFQNQNGYFDAAKLEAFLNRLDREKISLSGDIYETKIIEELELNISDLKEARKEALKEINEKKNDLILAYTTYLIPKIKELRDLVEQSTSETLYAQNRPKMQGLVDDFIRGYIAFYIPNAPRQVWGHDLSYLTAVQHARGFLFSKANNGIAANNLQVEKQNSGEIARCLGYAKEVGSYLQNQDVQKLRQCQIDLSQLNPGKSAIMDVLSPNDRAQLIQKILKEQKELFPQSGEDVTFSRVRFSGRGSRKMTAFFTRNGKKHKLKVKLGAEVHTDITASILGRLLGLHQDVGKWVPRLRLWLGETPINTFKSSLVRKYGVGALEFIMASGRTNGQDWVEFNDVLLEAEAPEIELKLEGFYPEAWDLVNRREHRAMLLWYSWIDLWDTKAGNSRVMLKKTSTSRDIVYSMQDVGCSLGGGIAKKNTRDFLNLLNSNTKGVVNDFSTSALTWNDSSVRILWNDALPTLKRFKTTTFDDLKWMARQIASIDQKEIRLAFELGGFPKEVVDLYTYKMSNRRNEMVRAFGLDNEFELHPVPDFQHYSPSPSIRNGKVITGSFPGHNHSEQANDGFIDTLSSFLSYSLPLENLLQNFTADLTKASSLDLAYTAPTLGTVAIPGVKLSIGRRVVPDSGMWGDTGARNYRVEDKLIIEVNINAGFFKYITNQIPVSLSGSAQIWRKEIAIIHFADSRANGYLAPFKLFSILGGFKHYIAYGLNAHEVLTMSDSYGFRLEANATPYSLPMVGNEIGAHLFWRHVSPIFFTRDRDENLQIYKEKTNTIGAGLHASLGRIDLTVMELAILGLDITAEHYWLEGKLYSFHLPQTTESASVQAKLEQSFEMEALETFFHGDKGDLSLIARVDVHLRAQGSKIISSLNFLNLFKKRREDGLSTVKIDMGDGTHKEFYRFYRQDSSSQGYSVPIKRNEHLALWRTTSDTVTVEMDAANPKNFLIMLENTRFKNKATRSELIDLINMENSRFSIDSAHPFYRDYVLPESSEIDRYQKLYFDNRVFVNGRVFYENITELNKRAAKMQIRNYFEQGLIVDAEADDSTRKRNFKNAFKKIGTSFMEVEIRRQLNQMLKQRNDPKELIQAVVKFVDGLRSHRYGISFLRDLVGKENMFVMGEIYGIYPSFSTTTAFEAEANRRFAGRSWGDFYAIPPVQAFLKENSALPTGPYVFSGVPMIDMFGSPHYPEPFVY